MVNGLIFGIEVRPCTKLMALVAMAAPQSPTSVLLLLQPTVVAVADVAWFGHGLFINGRLLKIGRDVVNLQTEMLEPLRTLNWPAWKFIHSNKT